MKFRAVPLLLVVASAACGLKLDHAPLGPEGKSVAEDTDSSTGTISLAGALAAVPALSVNATQLTLAEQVAAQADAGQLFQPAGCATVSTAGNVVTYTFAGCTGPWGNVVVSGTEVATFSPGDLAKSIRMETHGEGLQANGVAIEHSAVAVVTFGAAGKSLTWNGDFSGTTANGKHIVHSTDLDLVFGVDGCVEVDGTTSTDIGLRGLDLDIQNLRRCGPAGTCPTGTIVATARVTRVTVTLTFDGTEDVVARGKLGGEFDFKIDCTPPIEDGG